MTADDGRPNVLRLHAGSLILHVWTADPGFEIETPGGVLATVDRGIYRIDADGDEVHVSVYEGEATLASGRRRVQVEQGERLLCAARGRARRSAPVRRPRPRRVRALGRGARRPRVLGQRAPPVRPRRDRPLRGELESHGSWYFQADVGHVWRPYVARGLAAVLRRTLGVDRLRLDLDPPGALGLGALPLRALGLCLEPGLVLDSRPFLGPRLGALGGGNELRGLVPARLPRPGRAVLRPRLSGQRRGARRLRRLGLLAAEPAERGVQCPQARRGRGGPA